MESSKADAWVHAPQYFMKSPVFGEPLSLPDFES
jgi:hypothetical protein